MVRGPGEANYFRDYKRLEAIAKLATSYKVEPWKMPLYSRVVYKRKV